MVAQEITHDQIKSLLDDKYYLHYIDRNDSFENNLDEVGQAIRKQTWEPIDEIMEPSYQDNYAMNIALEELVEKLVDEFHIDKSEAETLVEHNLDFLMETIEERDQSTPLDDMFRNTGNVVAFYDTDVYLPDPFGEESQKESLKEIKKALKIKLSDKTYDDNIMDMILNASYGGRLVIYFNPDIKEFIYIEDKNAIEVSNPVVAIVDTMNGSGGDTTLKGLKFTLPFNPKNFFFDKEIKYNYTYAVCCMASNWCQSTNVSLVKRRYKKATSNSNLTSQIDREVQLNKTFQNGKCTHGDMDISRHRNVIYQNNPPMCGSLCKDCQTFWID